MTRPLPDAFCTSGNSPTPPAVLVLGGISAGPDLSWWSDLVGPGAPLDPRRFRLLTLSPGAIAGGTTHDAARAVLDELDRAGILRLHAAIGCSYGGLVALALAELAPHRVDRLVLVGAAHRPHPLATARREVQRRLARLPGGLALARSLALTTYRSGIGLDERFDLAEDLLSWLDHHGRAFATAFDAGRYVALSTAIDTHRVDPRRVPVPTLLIGLQDDELVPEWLLEELVDLLPDAAHVTVPTVHGHDGFLLETDALRTLLHAALSPRGEVAA